MSNMEQFDKHIRDAFGNYSPALPEGAWERIWAERERRKPKGVLFFTKRNLLLTAALLFCGAGAYWYTSYKPVNTDRQVTQKNISSNSNNPINPGNSTASATQNAALPGQIEKKGNEEKLNQHLEQGTTGGLDKGSNEQEAGITKSSAGKNDDDLLAPVNSVKKANRYGTRKSYFVNRALAEMGIDDVETDAGNTILSLNRSLYSSESIHALSLKASSKPALNLIKIPPCPQLEKDAAGNKSYWEVYAGPDYAYRKYNDTANSVYLQKRKATTSFHSAFSTGARYTRVFSNGISIRGGLNYSQVNEKFSFVQSNIVQVNYIIDPVTGDTTGSYTVRGTRLKTTYNHYHTVDLPISVGYEMGNGRLHANINAGIMINLFSWQKGETLDTSYQPVSFTTGKGNSLYQYKTNMGFGFTAASSIYYKLTENLHLLAEPYIRYNLSPMNKDNLSLQEKFTTIGLRLGLRMDVP